MKKFLLMMLFLGPILLTARAENALAQSCYDLWYARNAIFNAYGYCFTTSLGQRVFDNLDCYTSSPRLAAVDQRRVNAIRREERRRGCRVNR